MIDFQKDSFLKLRQVEEKSVTSVHKILIPTEEIIGCYKGIRDYVVFTDKRVITVNVQGATGKKKDFTSIPYSSIAVFSIETSGVFDVDNEIELFVREIGTVRFEFWGNTDISQIGKCISHFVLQ